MDKSLQVERFPEHLRKQLSLLAVKMTMESPNKVTMRELVIQAITEFLRNHEGRKKERDDQ